MFSFFRRRAMSQLQGYYRYPFLFMTACKWVAPMSQAKFELFQQSLDNLFNWLENKDVAKGHFISRNQVNSELLLTLKRGLGYQLTPVVIANSLDLLIDVYPTVAHEPAKTGIIHIGRYNWLNIREQNKNMEVMNMLKKCYANLDVFSIGTVNQELDLEDISSEPIGDALRFNENVKEFIENHEQILVSFDVSSMAKNSEGFDYRQRENEIKKFLEVSLNSEKLRLVLLIADSDRALYSRKTKVIYDGLKELAGCSLQHA